MPVPSACCLALFTHCYQDYGLIPSTQMLLSNGEVEQGVRDGSLDIGIMTVKTKLQELDCECVGQSPLVALMKGGAILPGAPDR